MTKKSHNRLWYISEDDRNYQQGGAWKPFPKGTQVCFDHDDPKCKICPKCKDSQLCESCSAESERHTESEIRECHKTLNERSFVYSGFESMISQLCMHSLSMDEVEMDGRKLFVRDMDQRHQV